MSRSRHHRGSSRSGVELGRSESRADRKERTRQALIDASLTLVGERSFGDVSLREVTKAAGVVPTAFYRHFDSMDDLAATLATDSARTLRKAIRDGRGHYVDRPEMLASTEFLTSLTRQTRAHEPQLRFLVRERFGGSLPARRTIDIELRLLARELAIELARNEQTRRLAPEQLELIAELFVTMVLQTIAELLDVDRRSTYEEDVVIDRIRQQLTLVLLGVQQWRTADAATA